MACLNLTLYPNSTFPRSLWKNDVRTLSQLCHQFAGGHYSIEIIHLAEEPKRAFHDGVFTTPAILLETKGGRKQMLGNFAQTEKFLKSLQAPVIDERPEPSSFRPILPWKVAV